MTDMDSKEFFEGFSSASKLWIKIFQMTDITRTRFFLLQSTLTNLTILDPIRVGKFLEQSAKLNAELDKVFSDAYKRVSTLLDESRVRIESDVYNSLKNNLDTVFTTDFESVHEIH